MYLYFFIKSNLLFGCIGFLLDVSLFFYKNIFFIFLAPKENRCEDTKRVQSEK
jgi:hypothetical protein